MQRQVAQACKSAEALHAQLAATQDTHVPGTGCRASAAAAKTPAIFRAAGEGPLLFMLEPCAPHIVSTKKGVVDVVQRLACLRCLHSIICRQRRRLTCWERPPNQVHLLTYKAQGTLPARGYHRGALARAPPRRLVVAGGMRPQGVPWDGHLQASLRCMR